MLHLVHLLEGREVLGDDAAGFVGVGVLVDELGSNVKAEMKW